MPQKVFRMYSDYSVQYVPRPDLGTRCRHEWRHGTQECVRHGSLQQKAADLNGEIRATGFILERR